MKTSRLNIPDGGYEVMSEEMTEIITYRPSWLIRRANFIFLFLLCALLCATWFIRYPDIIKGPVRLYPTNTPRLLAAKSEGKLKKLLVTNEQVVSEGQQIAFLQSVGQHDQIISLQQSLMSTDEAILQGGINDIKHISLPEAIGLGEIQEQYLEFLNIFNETLETLPGGYYQNKKNDLLKDLQIMEALQNNTQKQTELIQIDLHLQEIDSKAKEMGADGKTIAPLEVNVDKSKKSHKKTSLENLTAQLINDNFFVRNKEKEIRALEKFIADQQGKFMSALFVFESHVELWIKKYIITAPIAGKVLFTSTLNENQWISLDQKLFYVLPNEGLIRGEMMVAQAGIGKIKLNQKVLIKTAAYPSEEYGYLTGRVNYIPPFTGDNDSFLIKIDLPKGMITNYGQKIKFGSGLKADAEVLTNNKRLLERFLGEFRRISAH